MSKFASGLESALNVAPPLQIEVLTAGELDLVTGGGPYEADCTTGSRSMCMDDGVQEGD